MEAVRTWHVNKTRIKFQSRTFSVRKQLSRTCISGLWTGRDRVFASALHLLASMVHYGPGQSASRNISEHFPFAQFVAGRVRTSESVIGHGAGEAMRAAVGQALVDCEGALDAVRDCLKMEMQDTDEFAMQVMSNCQILGWVACYNGALLNLMVQFQCLRDARPFSACGNMGCLLAKARWWRKEMQLPKAAHDCTPYAWGKTGLLKKFHSDKGHSHLTL